MKNKGFSLIELLITLTILAIIMTYGYHTFSDTRATIQAEIDRQYLLKIPLLLEQFFADNLTYPEHLGEILNSNQANFYTPKAYYLIAYRRGTNNNYFISARLNADKQYADKIACAAITIGASGKITGYDNSGNIATNLCWK